MMNRNYLYIQISEWILKILGELSVVIQSHKITTFDINIDIIID